MEAFENPDLKNVLALAGFYNGGVVEVVSEVYFEGESTLMSPAGQRAVFDKIRSFKLALNSGGLERVRWNKDFAVAM